MIDVLSLKSHAHRFLRGVLFVLALAASITTLLAITLEALAQTQVPDAPTAVAVYSIESQKLEVRWSTSDAASTTSFKVQWKSESEEFDSSRQLTSDPATSIEDMQSTSAGDRYVHTLTGLTDGAKYTVRVIAANANGDSEPSAEATGTPQSGPGPARKFWENEVIKIFESSSPWLRETWDYIESKNASVVWSQSSGGAGVYCSGAPSGESNLRECYANSVFIARDLPRLIYNITHELAHVYTLANGVTTTPGPLGVARLYFHDLAFQVSLGKPLCTPIEIYADAVVMLTLGAGFPSSGTYWSGCSVTSGNDTVTEQALAVVRSATAGQMPSWLADTYNDADGNPELERVWADLKAIPEADGKEGGVSSDSYLQPARCVRRLLRQPEGPRLGVRKRDYPQSMEGRWLRTRGAGECDSDCGWKREVDPVLAGAARRRRIDD